MLLIWIAYDLQWNLYQGEYIEENISSFTVYVTGFCNLSTDTFSCRINSPYDSESFEKEKWNITELCPAFVMHCKGHIQVILFFLLSEDQGLQNTDNVGI